MTAANDAFPHVNPTASLLLSHRPVGRRVVIIGSGRLAASRAFATLEAGAVPIIVALPSHSNKSDTADLEACCEELQWRIERDEVQLFAAPRSDTEGEWTKLIEELDVQEEAGNAIFAVCITDTLHLGDEVMASSSTASFSSSAAEPTLTPAQRSMSRARLIQRLCRQRRILINVADQPSLCDFSFPAAHRFPVGDGAASALQVAVTTNGRGCRLAGRIRREIVAALPRSVGDAVERVGDMRELARAGDRKRRGSIVVVPTTKKQARVGAAQHPERDEEDSALDSTPLNSPVPQLKSNGSYFGNDATDATDTLNPVHVEAERTKRRMRWVAQISEYWPIEYLGSLKEEQMAEILDTYAGDAKPATSSARADGAETPRGRHSSRRNSIPSTASSEVVLPASARRDSSQHSLALVPPPPILPSKGHIYLLGSGPGHPGLLTTMAHALLTSPSTHLVLSDKLVPAAILRLVPSSTPLVIARKFPGNAEGAQSELIALALRAALEEGKTVVRLKQGDPFVYGRGGEEVLAFRKAGIECTVVPGISSSMAAPLMLGVPVTQRGAADSMVLCTGVGRGGKLVKLPGYERARSTVILMGVARLKDVVATLTQGWSSQAPASAALACGEATKGRNGAAYPPHTPIAIIERASSADQRLVASTLGGIVEALERTGEQRPPGMMLIGWAVLSLHGEGDVTVLDDETKCLEACTAKLEQGGEVKQEAYDAARTALDTLDRKRVERWLGQRGYVVREGLSQAYAEAIARFSPSSSVESAAPQEAFTPPLSATAVQKQAPDLSLAARDATGWAPPRYAGDKGLPSGGWASNEVAPYTPAADRAAWQRDEEYARTTRYER